MIAADLWQSVVALLLLAGSIFAVVSAVGVVRLPDLYTRMHAASKAGVVGAGLILLAVALISADYAVVLRAILGIVFLVLTTPVSAHLLARAAYLSGVKPDGATNINDLQTDISK